MISWRALWWLFLLERPHQWLAILRPAAPGEADGRAARRFAAIVAAIAILEALAFYVGEPRVLWAAVYWTQTLHAAHRAAVWTRRCGRAASCLAAVAFLGASVAAARAGGADVWSWFGAPGVLAGGATGETSGPTALLLLWTFGHALPETALALRGLGLVRGALFLTAAVLCTWAEWWLVAATIGFPGTLLFPDLANVVDLGREEGLWVVPFWTAPFFVHVALETRRSFRAAAPRA